MRWTIEQAKDWYEPQPWLVGCNFIPSTAINQLEMWQEATYDPATIDRELGWAAGLGFNTLRVFLHDLVWRDETEGFARRIDDFLAIAQRHGIRPFFVFFDDCHRPDPRAGAQPLPVRGVHNSGWAQSPGRELALAFEQGAVLPAERARLRDYVHGVLDRFGRDERILMWDVYNEPGHSVELLREAWAWAREAGPVQPLTACVQGAVGAEKQALNAANSDIITFHEYAGANLEALILNYQAEFAGRPLMCTEFMARGLGSTFHHDLPIFARHRVGCCNWGLVVGKTQTHFGWETMEKLEERKARGEFLREGDPIPEPELWFHEILRPDGTPYDPQEVEFIRTTTRKTRASE